MHKYIFAKIRILCMYIRTAICIESHMPFWICSIVKLNFYSLNARSHSFFNQFLLNLLIPADFSQYIKVCSNTHKYFFSFFISVKCIYCYFFFSKIIFNITIYLMFLLISYFQICPSYSLSACIHLLLYAQIMAWIINCLEQGLSIITMLYFKLLH